MKKLIVLFFMLLHGFGIDVNAQAIRSAFVEMPDTLMLLLTANDRRDCIDFIDAGMRAVVSNRLGGKSELKKLADDFLLINTTESSVMQMKLLPCINGDTVICMVNTVCAEVADSRISFYNRRWEKLSVTKFFETPNISDFFIPSDSVANYKDIADIYLVRLDLQSHSDSLRAEYTMPGYMSDDDSVMVAPMLQPLWYKWNGERFVIK